MTNITKITKIVKSETLLYTNPDDRNLFERVFSGLLNNTPAFSQTRTIRHELQFNPTEAELRGIIENFGELGSDSYIRNAGFVYNTGKRIMLTGAGVAFPYEFQINREENQLVSASDLLSAITRDRSNLLRPLDSPSFVVEDDE